eukprot:8090351-Lingulodinium_polyedra.AAC.1
MQHLHLVPARATACGDGGDAGRELQEGHVLGAHLVEGVLEAIVDLGVLLVKHFVHRLLGLHVEVGVVCLLRDGILLANGSFPDNGLRG